jgi:hypothetical protein
MANQTRSGSRVPRLLEHRYVLPLIIVRVIVRIKLTVKR